MSSAHLFRLLSPLEEPIVRVKIEEINQIDLIGASSHFLDNANRTQLKF